MCIRDRLVTSYTSEDSDLVATENNYAAKENELQQQIDNIHPDLFYGRSGIFLSLFPNSFQSIHK